MTKLQDLTPEEFEYLYSLMSQKRLAKTLEVTVNWVMNKVKEYGLQTKPKGRPVEAGFKFKGENKLPAKALAILERLKRKGELSAV